MIGIRQQDSRQHGITIQTSSFTQTQRLTMITNFTTFRIGRVLLASLFVISGIFKIVGFAGTVGYFTAWACRSRPWPCWSPSWSKSAAACCS
jgi:uncharacterized membrane protein YphA (DoxX/SURF4 family)